MSPQLAQLVAGESKLGKWNQIYQKGRRRRPRRLLVEQLEDRRLLAVFTWDGAPDAGGTSADANWMTATNWVGDVAPSAGSDLVFPAGGTDNKTNSNNYPAGTAFGSIQFLGSSYVLSGNAATLSGGIANSGSNNQLGFGLTLGATQTFASGGSLTLGGQVNLSGRNLTLNVSSGTLTLSAQLTGNGNLTKLGGGTATLQAAANTFNGSVVVNGGTLVFQGANQYAGTTTVQNGTLTIHNAAGLGTTAAGTSLQNGVLRLVGVGTMSAETLTVNSSTSPQLHSDSGNNTWTGNINFVNNQGYPRIQVNAGSLEISGNIGGGTPDGVYLYGYGNGLRLSGVNDYSTAYGTYMEGTIDVAGSLTPTSSNYSGRELVNYGTLNVSGTASGFHGNYGTVNVTGTTGDFFANSGTIRGTGTVGAVSSTGTLLPGADSQAGILDMGDLVSSGTYVVELNGATPGDGAGHHDQLNVTGTVTVGGFLQVTVGAGYGPAMGSQHVIIANDGTDAVTGNFIGLPEGSLIVVDNVVFQITYQGGSGNDVVLERVPAKFWDGAPDLGGTSVNGNWSTATNWVEDSAPVAGDHLVFPTGVTANQTSVNDYAAETAFGWIQVLGSNYSLGGNAVTLAGGINNSGANNQLGFALTLGVPQLYISSGSLTLGSQVNLSGHNLTLDVLSGTLTLNAPIAGNGNLTKQGGGTAALNAAANTFDGSVLVNGGTLVFQGANQYTGTTTVQNGTLTIHHAAGLGTAAEGTSLHNGFLRLVGVGTVAGESLMVYSSSSPQLVNDSGSNTWSGNIDFLENQGYPSIEVKGGSLEISGNIRGGTPEGVSFNGYGDGLLLSGDNDYSILNWTYIQGTVRVHGSLTPTSSNFPGRELVNLGTVTVNGTAGGFYSNSGTIRGTGTVGAVSSAGILQPGTVSQVGVLNTGNLVSSGTYAPDLNGATPGDGAGYHDQLNVTGTVSLGGTLQVTVAAGYVPTKNTEYVIIKNDGSEAVTGTFGGLAEGSQVTVGDYVFEITYAGGDGNDVMLTVLDAPNVAPEITAIETDPASVIKERPFQLKIDFTDPDLLDAHIVTIDWGDGDPPEPVTVPLGQRSVSVQHQYDATGTYAVSVRVADADLGEDATGLTVEVFELDFGDSPEPYPTRWTQDGARHIVVPGMHLGSAVDPEFDGQPDPNALGDDNNGIDDEDGVRLLTRIVPGSRTRLEVIASNAGYLSAWIDLNADGDWDDPAEHIIVDKLLVAGPNQLSFAVPATAVVTDSTFARFRFSSVGGLRYDGLAPDGEVEDYAFEIQAPDKMDIAGRVGDDGSWWVGESTGSQFASSPWGTWPAVIDWQDVRVGDFNGDGRVDLVGRYEGAWWVARSTGDGFVNEQWGLWSTAVTWEDVLVGDFNGDGRDDIAGRANGYWWLAKSTGTGFVNDRWDRWTIAAAWLDVQVADVDNDGRDDLVGRLSSTGDWTVALSTGTSFVSQTWGKWSAAISWTSVQVGDFNGDGRTDIGGRNSATGDWYVARSTGVGFVTEKWGVWSTGIAWKNIQVGDVSGDGRADIVGLNGGDWWVARSTGNEFVSERWATETASANWQDVQVGDVNGDGTEDLVGRINGDWWLASSSGSSFSVSLWTPWPGSVEWVDVRLGDVNADGAVDILGRTEGTWWVARQSDGSVIIEPWTQWPHVIVWEDVQAADVDGDGLDDIVARKNGVWWVAKSNGTGFTNESWGKWSALVAWEDVLVGDFNGDGRDDVAARASGFWWIAKSTGTSFVNERWGRWTTAAAWLDVHVADVNGDGRDDLVGRLSSSGDWTVALSTGTSFLNETWGRWNTEVPWESVQVGDFNRDGRDDIVGRNTATGDWHVAHSTGSSFVTRNWGRWSPSLSWEHVHVSDVDGDNQADLVGRIASSGDWYVARSNGTSFVTTKWGNWTTSSTWADVQAADVNGDGRDDIIGRDENGNWMVAQSTGTALVSEIWGSWSPDVTWQDALVGNYSHAIPAALHAAELASASETPVAATGDAVTEDAVQGLAEAAFARLTAATLWDDGGESLPSLKFQIADLPGTLLGQSLGQTILIDRDAAGFGWFVDLTPWDDEEFMGSAGGGDLIAVSGGKADGRMDLLTVVMHELGHLLGYDHSESGFMQPTLAAGIRQAFDVRAGSDDDQGSPDWETLLDDQPLDNTSVDACFAALD